jgi:hypothetical protein
MAIIVAIRRQRINKDHSATNGGNKIQSLSHPTALLYITALSCPHVPLTVPYTTVHSPIQSVSHPTALLHRTALSYSHDTLTVPTCANNSEYDMEVTVLHIAQPV